MKEQFTAILGILINPKRTMQQLSSTRIYALALIAPLYFGIARAFRPRNYEMLFDKLGGNFQIVLFVCVIAAIMIPLAAWFMPDTKVVQEKTLSD